LSTVGLIVIDRACFYRRNRLDRLCGTRSSASVYSDFRFPVLHRGPVTQYPLTAATTSTATTTTTTLQATKSRSDLESSAPSYESVGDVKTNRKPTPEAISGEAATAGTGNRNVVAVGDASPPDAVRDWVVSPGWKLRRRVTDTSTTNQLPVADWKSITGDDKSSSGGLSDNDTRSQSALGMLKLRLYYDYYIEGCWRRGNKPYLIYENCT